MDKYLFYVIFDDYTWWPMLRESPEKVVEDVRIEDKKSGFKLFMFNKNNNDLTYIGIFKP
jgi:hypothetical protein